MLPFFFPFPQSSVQLMVSGILSDLVLSVNFSFTCSYFLDYFLHVQKLREVAGFKAHRVSNWKSMLPIFWFVFWYFCYLKRACVLKFEDRIPKSLYCDLFTFGFLLRRVRVSSELDIIWCLLLFQVTAEAAMFHFFRKPPESKKPSVPETEADGFVLLGECF